MIKNNIEVDVKVKCIENGTTQARLAETIGTTGRYVNRIIKKQDCIVNKTFVQMLEPLGYDIELTYVKRKSDTGGDTFLGNDKIEEKTEGTAQKFFA